MIGKLTIVSLIALLLAGCAPISPGESWDDGRFVGVDVGPGLSSIVRDTLRNRCYVISTSYFGYRITSAAPNEWCEAQR